MLMKMRSRMQNQKGFTLVELMVVVVILGVLVAIAVPVYNNVSKNAKIKACDSNVRILNGAIEMYNADDDNADALVDVDLTETGNLIPDYIKEVPECPYGDAYELNDDGYVDKHDHSGEGN